MSAATIESQIKDYVYAYPTFSSDIKHMLWRS